MKKSKEATLQEINDLILEIDNYQENYNKKAGHQKSIIFLMKMASLKYIRSRLQKIQNILSIDKYKLVFIGKIGVGKTTAICHIFNLLVDEKKIIDDDPETVTTPLLSTGSGRTTICEVLIQSDPQTYIEIEPYSNEEMLEQIEIFCILVWKKLHPKAKGWLEDLQYQDEQIDILASEIKRAIKNIAKLKGKEEEEIARKHKSYESFRDEIVLRCNLTKRNKTILNTSHKDPLNKKKWIQKNFQDLNLGKITTCSIPKKIVIHIDRSVLDLDQYRFHTIVDTRGMDIDSDRADLSHHIRSADDTICIFCEKFSDIPSNIITLIKKYLTPESKDIDTKLGLLGLPQGSEPSDLMGQDGKVSSYNEGIGIRLDQVIDKFSSQGVQFIEENIKFYNSLRHYDSNKVKIRERKIEQERLAILDYIENIISAREHLLIEEVSNLLDLSKKIRAGTIDDTDKDLIEKLKKTITKLDSHKAYYSLPTKREFLEILNSYHVMVFRAINNRYGDYDYRNINIYFDVRSLTEGLARNHLEKPKSEIIGAIRRTYEQAESNSVLKSCLKILEDQIHNDYENLIIETGNVAYELLSEQLSPRNHNNQFWVDIISRWGQGPGYKHYVLEQYGKELGSIDEEIQQYLQESWQSKFLDKILEFLLI